MLTTNQVIRFGINTEVPLANRCSVWGGHARMKMLPNSGKIGNERSDKGRSFRAEDAGRNILGGEPHVPGPLPRWSCPRARRGLPARATSSPRSFPQRQQGSGRADRRLLHFFGAPPVPVRVLQVIFGKFTGQALLRDRVLSPPRPARRAPALGRSLQLRVHGLLSPLVRSHVQSTVALTALMPPRCATGIGDVGASDARVLHRRQHCWGAITPAICHRHACMQESV